MRQVNVYKIVCGFCILLMPYILIAQDGIVKGKVGNESEILPGATISLGNKVVLTDSKGEFVLTIKPGNYIITITHAGYLKIEKAITVIAESTQYVDFDLQPVDKMPGVIVVGSRSQKERSNLNTPVPIDLVQVSKLPAREVELTRILTYSIPSFNSHAHGFGSGK